MSAILKETWMLTLWYCPQGHLNHGFCWELKPGDNRAEVEREMENETLGLSRAGLLRLHCFVCDSWDITPRHEETGCTSMEEAQKMVGAIVDKEAELRQQVIDARERSG